MFSCSLAWGIRRREKEILPEANGGAGLGKRFQVTLTLSEVKKFIDVNRLVHNHFS